LHNTLTLDDRPQSVSNGPFHWSHVANSEVHRWRTNEAFDFFDGGHDGYRPLTHRRRVLALHGDLVVVADFVDGTGPHQAAVHWHLDPGWTLAARGRRAELTRADDTSMRIGFVVPQGIIEPFVADADTGLGWHSPVYGRLEKTTTIRVRQSGSTPFWMVSVFDLDADNAVADVDLVPVWAEAGVLAHATAIRITRTASVDHVLFVEPTDEDRTAAVKRGPWRVAEFETDARLLFCRTTADHPVARVALVDGSFVRVAGRRDFQLALPRVAPDFYWTEDQGLATKDQGPRTKDQGPRTKDHFPCAASPVS
jgi:hypothetical protein